MTIAKGTRAITGKISKQTIANHWMKIFAKVHGNPAKALKAEKVIPAKAITNMVSKKKVSCDTFFFISLHGFEYILIF